MFIEPVDEEVRKKKHFRTVHIWKTVVVYSQSSNPPSREISVSVTATEAENNLLYSLTVRRLLIYCYIAFPLQNLHNYD